MEDRNKEERKKENERNCNFIRKVSGTYGVDFAIEY